MKRDSETLRKTKQYFKNDQGLFDWKVAGEGGDLSSYQATGSKWQEKTKPSLLCVSSRKTCLEVSFPH